MAQIRISLRNNTKKRLNNLLQSAKNNENIFTVKRILTIFAVAENYTYQSIIEILKVSEESIRLWVEYFVLNGP